MLVGLNIDTSFREGEGAFQIIFRRWFRSDGVLDSNGDVRHNAILRVEVTITSSPQPGQFILQREGTLVLLNRILHWPMTIMWRDEVRRSIMGASGQRDLSDRMHGALDRFEQALRAAKMASVQPELEIKIGGGRK